VNRRTFLRAAAAAPLLTARPAGIRVSEVSIAFEEHRYRAAYVFGGRAVDRATLLNVTCRVRANGGQEARGFGSMPLGNQWAFPSGKLTNDETLGAMKRLAERLARITADCTESGHPLDLNHVLEPEYLKAAAALSAEMQLAEPIPTLCTLVTASPFDAAIHDAYGKLHGRSCYETYSQSFLSRDLAHYLGRREFSGEYLDRYLRRAPAPRIALFHSVGAGDPIEPGDVKRPIGDGLPEHLAEWIAYNGLTHIKIKLNGADLAEDVDRTVRVDRVAAAARNRWSYCLDFNERCRNVDYLIEFIRQVKERAPQGFDRILYIEQPTARDLKADRANRMHAAAKLKPVVIDESLVDLESLLLAREMGYTGLALKACKGQSQAMLMAAAGQKFQMFLTVQDLTCPGAALVHSASIAARVPGVAGLEANARQYMPAANKVWEDRHPGLFRIRSGWLDTSRLTGPGLGAVEA
jgi:L-alanine-DL-glutamate epimerase-like enolase superfamily enzyme